MLELNFITNNNLSVHSRILFSGNEVVFYNEKNNFVASAKLTEATVVLKGPPAKLKGTSVILKGTSVTLKGTSVILNGASVTLKGASAKSTEASVNFTGAGFSLNTIKEYKFIQIIINKTY